MGDFDSAESPGLIHVIVDDPGVRNSLAFLLEANGFVTLSYESAAEFLKAAPSAVGCVILGYETPSDDGLTSLARIRGERRSLPVIMLAGMLDTDASAFAREQGVAAIFETPLSEAELIAVVGSLTSSGEPTIAG